MGKTLSSWMGLPDKVTPGYEPTLDGWRAVAILLVMYEHFVGATWLDAGRMGVNFFFALSGSLMGYILFVKKTPLQTFYQRRFTRVFPLFWLYVSFIYLAAWLAGEKEAGNVLYTLFFLRTYLPDDHIWLTGVGIGHLWSLNIEEHAYVIMSLLALFGLHRRRHALSPVTIGVILIAVGGLSVVWHYISIRYQLAWELVELYTHTNLSYIFLAAGYQVLYQHYQWRLPARTAVVSLSVALAVATHFHEAHWFAWQSAGPVLLALAVNHVHETGPMLKRLLSLSWLRLVGLWSFSLYIWQQPFYLWSQGEGGAAWLAAVGATAVAVVSFYFFENPVRHRLNRRWTGRR